MPSVFFFFLSVFPYNISFTRYSSPIILGISQTSPRTEKNVSNAYVLIIIVIDLLKSKRYSFLFRLLPFSFPFSDSHAPRSNNRRHFLSSSCIYASHAHHTRITRIYNRPIYLHVSLYDRCVPYRWDDTFIVHRTISAHAATRLIAYHTYKVVWK